MDEGEVVNSCYYDGDGDGDGNRKNLCRRDEARTPGSCIVTTSEPVAQFEVSDDWPDA